MSDDGNIDGGLDGDKVLVAEYALGLLDAAEHARVAKRLASEPALAAELQLWQSRLASLDTEFAEVAPPAGVLGKVEARLYGSAAEPGPVASFWNSLALWRGLAAAGVAVAAIAIGINLTQPPQVDPKAFAAELVAAIQAEGSNVSFVALYNPATGSVRLTSLSGDAVPEKDYELWAIQGGNAPISMGVIPVHQKADVKLERQSARRLRRGHRPGRDAGTEGRLPHRRSPGPPRRQRRRHRHLALRLTLSDKCPVHPQAHSARAYLRVVATCLILQAMANCRGTESRTIAVDQSSPPERCAEYLLHNRRPKQSETIPKSLPFLRLSQPEPTGPLKEGTNK